jgi:hypothetical protein
MVTVETLYNISIDKMWIEVLNAARRTVNKNSIEKVPSETFKKNILKSEHSPIRLMWFKITMIGIPTHISQQFSRHIISGMHEQIEKTDSDDFVRTQRTDRTGIDRSQLSQIEPVEHLIIANAKGLIDMSRKRLCKKADPDAVKWWKEVVIEMEKICPELAEKMKPDCYYRGHCYEIESCGLYKSNLFEKELDKYRND